MEKNNSQVICYQKFYRIKEGKLVEIVNNKIPSLESDEDLILFQVVDANIGFNVLRYTKTSINHVKWFEERDKAIEYSFIESLKEQIKLDPDSASLKLNSNDIPWYGEPKQKENIDG
jgi:hypothetical protein